MKNMDNCLHQKTPVFSAQPEMLLIVKLMMKEESSEFRSAQWHLPNSVEESTEEHNCF